MKSIVYVVLLSGCYSKWEAIDSDGDGRSILEGDCWDYATEPVPPEGAEDYGVKASDIYRGAEDLPYDGIDANCDGLDDFDVDGDGFVPIQYVGIQTLGVETSGQLEGGDCWDSVDSFVIDARLGERTFTGSEVHPRATEQWYDGVDANCDGQDDFDQDHDGFVPDRFEGIETFFREDSSTLPVGDCWDSVDADYFNPAGVLAPDDVHPGAPEQWYDGTDADCSGGSDCDQDGDGFDTDIDNCVEIVDSTQAMDCNDQEATVFPNDSQEIYYNGIDDNCDDRDGDGDKDGDGYWDLNYPFTQAEVDVSVVVPLLSDCWDDPDMRPTDFVSLNGFSELAADEIHPNAMDRWYDGVNQDCGETEDFDQDGDGFATRYYVQRNGAVGEDCIDAETDPEFIAGGIAPVDIYPGNPNETYYDGVDQNCDFLSDYDADEDGQDAYFYGGEDCDDSTAFIYFDVNLAEGVDDGVDQNCDGLEACWLDVDQDGYGNALGLTGLSTDWSCSAITGFSSTVDDCDDGDTTVHPNATELCDGQVNACGMSLEPNEVDNDGDGFVECTIDAGGWDVAGEAMLGGDCNDGELTVNPAVVWYADTDGDGYGDLDSTIAACVQPTGYQADSTDCDDTDATVYPNAPTLCDGQVNACGTSLDPNEVDNDEDGFVECMIDAGGWDVTGETKLGEDCNDGDATVYPNAPTLCDGQVNSCGTSLDPNEVDNDGDGFVECTIDVGGWDVTGEAMLGGDCNDGDATVKPTVIWYADTDGDGFGYALSTTLSCLAPAGYSALSTDCDDTDGTIYPNAPTLCDGQVNACGGALPAEEIDGDLDGYVDCVIDAGGWDVVGETKLGEDCDDGDPTVYPNAPTLCDGQVNACGTSLDLNEVDNDGDGFVECTIDAGGWDVTGETKLGEDCDDGDPNIHPNTLWYADIDNDGYGAPGATTQSCTQPTGYRATSTDCDDGDGTVYPNAPALCDGQVNACGTSLDPNEVDNDGDGFVECIIDAGGWDITGETKLGEDCNDGDPNIHPNTLWYLDFDNDGYGDVDVSMQACTPSTGYIADSSDCDDDDGTTHPNATELCDGIVNACVGSLPAEESDVDSDGFVECIIESTGWRGSSSVVGDDDCDDGDPNIHPDTLWYLDNDGDGYGDADVSMQACTPSTGYIADSSDCDDNDSFVYPGAIELLGDGIDQDCDGQDLPGLNADDLQLGDLIVTEMMIDGFLSNGVDEWVELYNTTSQVIDPYGLIIADSGSSTVIDQHFSIEPGEYFLIVHNADSQQNGGLDLQNIQHYVQSTYVLNNTGDTFSLSYDNGVVQTTLASVTFSNSGTSDFNYAKGVSTIVDDLSIVDNDNAAYWCSSRSLHHQSSGNSYFATPGEPNDLCDMDLDDDFYYVDGSGDCDDNDDTRYRGATEIANDGIDQDCDEKELCPRDNDGDGYGDDQGTQILSTALDCIATGVSNNADDCDDGTGKGSVYPYAPEISGDGIDQNCDGLETSESLDTCTSDAVYQNGQMTSYWLVCTTTTDWISAHNLCVGAEFFDGSTVYDGLPKILNSTENTTLGSISGNLWIGLNDRDVEGEYRWDDNTLLDISGQVQDYQNWKTSFAANQSQVDDCFRMNNSDEWEVKSCSDTNNKIACSKHF